MCRGSIRHEALVRPADPSEVWVEVWQDTAALREVQEAERKAEHCCNGANHQVDRLATARGDETSRSNESNERVGDQQAADEHEQRGDGHAGAGRADGGPDDEDLRARFGANTVDKTNPV